MNVRGTTGVPRAEAGPAVRQVPGGAAPAGGAGAQSAPLCFAQVLAETAAGLRISEHARQRLRSAGFGPHDLEPVGRAVEKLAARGGRESLVMYRDAAFLVSVRNRTLITVVPAARMREQVFTNIDSAAFVSSEDNPSGAGPAWEATGERRA